MRQPQTHAFTLIEILIGIVIFAIIIVWGFQALWAVNIGKVRIMEAANTTKDMLYMTEKLITEIKQGGVLDYEEYFNRRMIGLVLKNGHYTFPSGFGNFGKNFGTGNDFWESFYYCRSGDDNTKNFANSSINPELWCFDSAYAPTNTWWGVGDSWSADKAWLNTQTKSWEKTQGAWNIPGDQQRYGQYSFQVMDYNGNLDNDQWDENGDGNIIWDDDDENTGYAPRVTFNAIDPSVITNTTHEIYLISADKKHRTYFRWNWKVDENAPDDKKNMCQWSDTFVDWCIGTIEILKLEWVDWGKIHDPSIPNIDPNTPSIQNTDQENLYDGIIDTWLIDKVFDYNYNPNTPEIRTIAGAESVRNNSQAMDVYWQPLFSDDISVTDFQVEIYPHTDTNLWWKNFEGPDAEIKNKSINIAPYLRLSLTLQPSWKKRVSGNPAETATYKYTTTIHLDEIFSSQ